MKNADKNRDPARARKRATADLRCAARKLGPEAAVAVLMETFDPALVLECAQESYKGVAS